MQLMETNPQCAMMMMQQDSIRDRGYPMAIPQVAPSAGRGPRNYSPGIEQSGNPYASRAGY